MNVKVTSIFFILLVVLVAHEARAWEVDFSHHKKPEATKTEVAPDPVVPSAPVEAKKDRKDLEGLVAPSRTSLPSVADRQELVILNTAKGFVPNNVRVRKGVHYLVHVVNVNEGQKNVSFIMDAYNQHYGTYYGEIKTFNLDPDKEGVFEFECPETSANGKLVVFGPGGMPAALPERSTASERR